jgi:sugar-specific transcriptional regulator TrmB
MEHLLTALNDLGLTSYEAAAYLAMLGRSCFTPTELANRAKIPRQRIYDVLSSLEEKGLCLSKDTSPRSFVAIAPQLALEALNQQRAAAFERERQRLAKRSEELIAELSPLYQLGRDHTDPLSYIDVLGDPIRISVKALELARSVRFCVNSCIKHPMILTPEQNLNFIQEPLKRGVLYRAIYEMSALDDAELRGLLMTCRQWGQDIRLIKELPIKMQSFDDEVVLVSLQDPVGGPPSFTALTIRNQGMVTMMNLAFERLWDKSEPLETYAND